MFFLGKLMNPLSSDTKLYWQRERGEVDGWRLEMEEGRPGQVGPGPQGVELAPQSQRTRGWRETLTLILSLFAKHLGDSLFCTLANFNFNSETVHVCRHLEYFSLLGLKHFVSQHWTHFYWTCIFFLMNPLSLDTLYKNEEKKINFVHKVVKKILQCSKKSQNWCCVVGVFGW